MQNSPAYIHCTCLCSFFAPSSFDAGYGSTHMARIVGQKKAREIWFLCKCYTAQEALDMGLVNTVVPLKDLEKVLDRWAYLISRIVVARTSFYFPIANSSQLDSS